MLTVYDDPDVLVLDPVAEEALVPDAGALAAELEVDAVDVADACAVLCPIA
ncbi:hypothetical protein [Paraburkholderia sediminicola]|uniref:hypothetical protein n=1 Tax=Paraburkholderia sediminicola TaxID=458836 RepID=UPI0038BAEE6B